MKIPLFLLFVLSPLVFASQPAASPPPQEFPDVCQSGENILPNCNFDNGLGGWQPYLEEGSAHIEVQQGGGECHAPLCPAAHIVTESHFVGGIYQQVPVTRGNSYYANIVWLAFDSLVNDASINAITGGIGRRIGIDPTGGTDSRSPNVVWSPDNWRNDCKICNVEAVTVTAEADTITVFLRIDNTWRLRAAEKGHTVPPSKDQFWLDDIGMKQVDGSAAPAPAPTDSLPTETPPPPPTDTPVPEQPTETSVPPADLPEATTEAVAQLESQAETVVPLESEPDPEAQLEATTEPEVEIVSPLATPPAAKTIAPPPTLTPTNTPSPTATFEPRPSPAPTRFRQNEPASSEQPPVLSAGLLGVVGTTACMGGVLLLIMAAVMTGLVWLYRLGWGNSEEDLSDDDDDDDEEEIEVEIVE